MGQEDYTELSSFLKRFILRVRFIKGMEGAGLILACALVSFSLGFGVLAIKGYFPYAPAIYSLLTIASITALFIWTVFQCFRRFSREESARYIEEKNPQLKNNLINSLQLYPHLQQVEKSDISASMVLALLRVTRTQLQKIQLKDLVSKERLKAEGRLLALLLIPVAALIVFNPISVRETFSLLVHPLKDLPPSETVIDVIPKGARLLRGSSLLVQASTSGAIPKSLNLFIRPDGAQGEGDKLYMDPAAEGQFSVTIPGIQQSSQYRATVGPFTSPWYDLEAVDPPVLGNLKATIFPPDYTGLPMQTVQGGNIEAIMGSTISLDAESNKELAKAKIILDQGREIPLKIKGKRLQGKLVLLQSQAYQMAAEDAFGFGNSPITYELRAQPDQFPSVELKRPVEDLEVSGDEALALEYAAKDDFGIQEVFLVARVRGKEERVRIRKEGSERLLPGERYLWEMSKLELQEGDVVTYYIEVRDNDTISGPKSGTSRSLRLRLKNLKAEHKQVAERIHDLSNDMMDFLADHLEQDLSAETPEVFQKSKVTDPNLENKAQEMIKRIDELMKRTETDRLSNFATWSDLRSLRRNLEFTKDELLPKMNQAVDPQDKARIYDEIASELERMSLLAEDMSKRLTAQEVSSTAHDLMKTQERLLDSLGQLQSGDKELDKVLEDLSRMARQLGELQQAMSQMASRLPQEFMNSEAVRGLDFRQMMSGLDEIRKKLMEGDIEGAKRLARELFNQMASMVAALRNAHQSSMSSAMARMQGEMTRSSSELQRIAREQQQILEETEREHKKVIEQREELLEGKLEGFQANAKEELSALVQLFPDQESEYEHEGEEPPQDRAAYLDEATMNNMAKAMLAALSKNEFEKMKRILAMARRELEKKHTADQQQKAAQADAGVSKLEAYLKTLLEEPAVPLTAEQQKTLAELASRQGLVKDRTEALHQRFKPLFQLFPSLDPKILKNIEEAGAFMGHAHGFLGDRKAGEAIPPEQTALERLQSSNQQMQNSMQQLAQRGQLGRAPVTFLFRRGRFLPSGRLVPLPGIPKFPDFEAEGGMTGLDKERFELPGKDDYRVPPRFREEILESLKQGLPDQFKDQIENYFKDLSQ